MGRRPRLSNRLARATFVYGDSRIFYNVGFRRRGSPFTRSSRNWRVVFGAENLDGRRSMTLDGQGGDGTRLNERLTYWMIEQLRAPNVRQEYVYFRLLGHEEGVYEDVEKVDGDFLASWFEPKKGKMAETKAPPPREPGPRRGKLHKVDDYFELFSGGDQAYREADLVFKTLDPEDYRWNFPPRANGSGEDFKPLLELLRLLDSRKTPDQAFDEEIEKVVDVDEWLKVLAARTLVDDWDTLGRRRGKNCFLYLSGDGQRWRLVIK